ncbi:hypothetical protein NLI96_g3140 [Meripilus lineatus]|uniref:Anaphase-promoting complex subunit 4 WD40 domain-containing protein n=1 Tax=Meripilus lineatus TaxID=2056292 RepID=A0AAD5VC25_9APHY|nr:hypothetical protein NLI96_g3140 [Physisporinus lineatus]
MILSIPAHVGGCMAAALDPRGRYLATGGNDSIVNLFDTTDWICTRTITSCDHAINAVSFSYDGEYLAIASSGSYIDISATETGLPVHRIPTLGPSPTTKIREGGPPPSAWLTIFGVGG